MNKKVLTKILLIVFSIVVLYSIVPVLSLYFQNNPELPTNVKIIEKFYCNKGDSFEFIVLGDNHAGLIFNDSAALKLIKNMNREDRFKKIPVDFVMVSGDVTFRGSEWDYWIYNKIKSRIKWPVISAIGNHDADKHGRVYFAKYYGKPDFSFVDRNSYFIVLDNIIGDLREDQFAWFEKELEKSAAYAHRFVTLHKSPRSLYQQSWFRPELSPWAYRFMKLCEKYKVDIVFSGHEHLFKEETFGGVKYIISGGGGNLIHFPDSEGGFLHYLTVRVFGDYVDYEVRKIVPPFWELLTYYIWKDLFYCLEYMIL